VAWWGWLLIGWAISSVGAALLIGAVIALADRRERREFDASDVDWDDGTDRRVG
jgi:hypothetical protein